MSIVEPLPHLLRRLREERGFVQSDLAERAGYTVQVVATTEQGRTVPKRLSALSLFKTLALAKPLTETEAHDFLYGCTLIGPSPFRRLPRSDYNRYVQEGLIVPVVHDDDPGQPGHARGDVPYPKLTKPVAFRAVQLQTLLGTSMMERLLDGMLAAFDIYHTQAVQGHLMVERPDPTAPDGYLEDSIPHDPRLSVFEHLIANPLPSAPAARPPVSSTPMIKHPPRETPDGFTVQVIEPNPPQPPIPAPSPSTTAPARPTHRRKAQ